MSQRDQQHMVMPSQPTTHLIMIQANFAFNSLKMVSIGHLIPLMRTNSITGVLAGALLK